MLLKYKKLNKKNQYAQNEDGFITMIVMMLIILGVVIYFAYMRVSGA